MFQILNFKFQNKNGFTLIEGMVSIAIFLVIFLALFALFGIIFSTIRNNKAKVTANSIALEQLEIIRGMNFDDVATDTGWVPPGPIPSEIEINRGAFNFIIKVDITFVDDPFDGIEGESPDDLFPFDYKKARVKVIWTNPVTKSQEEVAMSTNIVPLGLEGGTGIMVVVIDAEGAAVPNAIINITNDNFVPSDIVNNALTDLNGNLWVGGLDPSGGYHITATKNGCNSAQTYPMSNELDDPDELPYYNPNPSKPDAVVVDEMVTKVVLSIDLLGSLEISTVNNNNPQNWRVNTDSGSDDQTDIDLAIDDSDMLYFVWVNTGTTKRLYAQKYDLFSHVSQWGSDVQITTSNKQINPKIETAAAVDGDYFYIVWNDDSTGNQGAYLQKFNCSDGSSVLGWNKININVEANNDDQIKPDLAIDSAGNIYVTWMDNRNGNWDIYAQKYDPAGNDQWEGVDLKINSDSVGSNNQDNPRIAVDDEGNFYVVWEDEINENKDIFLARFGGTNPFAGKKINTGDSLELDQYEPDIVFDGVSHLYLCWSDERETEPDIYAQKYDKTGMRASSGNWTGGDIKINNDSTPEARRTKPAIAFFGNGAIYFSWQDDRNGPSHPDIYSAKLDSDGNKLWDYDLIVNNNSSSLVRNDPAIVTDSFGYAITAWEDFRNENDYDIYAARYNDFASFLRINVPITVTGEKLKGTYPLGCTPEVDCLPIYKYEKDFVSDTDGKINIGDGINEIEWDRYSFTAGGGYTILDVEPAYPLQVDPSANEVIIINVES